MSVRESLEGCEAAIKTALKIRPLSSNGWADEVPMEAGVYVVWGSDAPVYVGETSSLRLRMRDLARPVNHSFARKIAKDHNLLENDYAGLARIISGLYSLSYITVGLGRAEIEEYLILRWRKTLVNKPTKRLLHSEQYRWVIAE